ASAFADTIQVQRSSISHLLSGRNKPSLEFVLKVVKNFPEVNLYWLLNGKGSFPAETTSEGIPRDKSLENTGFLGALRDTRSAGDSKKLGQHIERIVIFYSDGSFDAYGDG
ncbi:MAG TPA: helix-turn-helix transcriptional regulator, partial [Pricia sp.]|nr:helix-turn-helix transcriptional regulator [Pricia sp.]